MKLISWNVNGIRACVGKNFMEFFNEVDDIINIGIMLRKKVIQERPYLQRKSHLM